MSFLSFNYTPKGVSVVQDFDVNKYLGTWYEIARMDYRFERNLKNVTAHYSLNSNGTIKVDNKGYDTQKNKWKQSIGKAKPVNKRNEGRLKVSFFGPFYAGYNIVQLDNDYHCALIIGQKLDYVWILSREKTIPDSIRTKYLSHAKSLGVDVEALIWVQQD